MNASWAEEPAELPAEEPEPSEGSDGGGGNQPAYRIFEQRGIFDFTEVHQLANEHFGQYLVTTADAEERVEFTRDAVYLSAAEFASLTIASRGVTQMLPMYAPMTIGTDAMRAAIIKADCGGLDYHARKGHEDAMRLWDIALFGGDMSKIELMHGDRLRLDEVEDFIAQLEQRFAGSETTIGRTIGSSGMLKVQGALWKAKLAINVAPNDVESQINRYLHRFPLVVPKPDTSPA